MPMIQTLIARSPLKRLRKPGKILYPRSLDRQYAEELVRIVGDLKGQIDKVLLSRLPQLQAAAPFKPRKDAWYDDLDGYIEEISTWWGRSYTDDELRALARRTGKSVDYWSRRELTKSVTRVLEMPVFFQDTGLSEQLESWTYENARLITKVGDDLIGQVQGIVSRGIQDGTLWQDIRDEITGTGIEAGRFGTAEKRAEGIARDQVGKLFGDLAETRQTSLGVEKYTWRTAQDSRVREEHAAREGEVFSWDDPPEDGHPGQPIMCRCWAEPVIEEES